MKRAVALLYIIIVAFGHNDINAQELNIGYTNEFQTNFKDRYNWVNLFRIDYTHRISNYYNLEASTISIAKTNNDRILNDLQTFSNIEEDNLTLAFSVFGIRYNKNKCSVFWGVRNVNEDFFTSPVTSLFTNSSCGIFPTISTNYPLANYPVSSMCVDFSLSHKNWLIQSAFYNGVGYKNISGRENVFRFCPKSDGLLNVTSLNYNNNGSNFYLGGCFHSGMHNGNEIGDETQTEETQPKKSIAVWSYIEQDVGEGISFMAQYSINSDALECKRYCGLGAVIRSKDIECGVFTDYAAFMTGKEYATEITCKFPVIKNGFIQPTIHFIYNGYHILHTIGIMRFCIGL